MVLGGRTRALAVKALGYAKGDLPSISLDDKTFREFIVWLEDTKIRALPMNERGPLRAVDASSSEWHAAFSAFAKEVGCELNVTATQNAERVFDYLLEQALALDYRDNADDLGSIVKNLKMATISHNTSSGGGIPPPSKRQRVASPRSEDRKLMSGLSDPALRSRLKELATVLQVDVEGVMGSNQDDGGGVEALVEACVRAVERFIAPFWMVHVEDQKQSGGGKGEGRERSGGDAANNHKKKPTAASWNLKVTDFPSGIEVGGAGGGAAVEAAVNVLRVLHINDLRVLQSAVDALLVQMQEYTSDPKTDSKLGRVGTG